jgi:hypothetical protein
MRTPIWSPNHRYVMRITGCARFHEILARVEAGALSIDEALAIQKDKERALVEQRRSADRMLDSSVGIAVSFAASTTRPFMTASLLTTFFLNWPGVPLSFGKRWNASRKGTWGVARRLRHDPQPERMAAGPADPGDDAVVRRTPSRVPCRERLRWSRPARKRCDKGTASAAHRRLGSLCSARLWSQKLTDSTRTMMRRAELITP